MATTSTGNKARWAPQTRRKACMGWSWAAACGVQGRGHIVAAGRPIQLVPKIVGTIVTKTVTIIVCSFLGQFQFVILGD